MIKLLVLSCCLFSSFLYVNSRPKCSKFTCTRRKEHMKHLLRVASLRAVPYLAGIRRVGSKEPFCFGVVVKETHILTSRFCDEDINSIEALHVPLNSIDYETIETATIVKKRIGKELMSYHISKRLTLQNGYFKSKFADVLWNEMVEMSKNDKKVMVLGFGSYGFIPDGKTEMPNTRSLMFSTYDIKSAFSRDFVSRECCARVASSEDTQAWNNKEIFVLESFRHDFQRCFAETGGPVISTQNGHIYGIVRGHYKCSSEYEAQIVVSALVDEEIITPIVTGNTKDVYPPILDDDNVEFDDSSTGVGISEKDPIKLNQTLKDLAYYGNDYYYGKSSIMDKDTIVYLTLIKLIF